MPRFIWIVSLVLLTGCGSRVRYDTKGGAPRKIHQKFATEKSEFSTKEQPGNVNYMVTSYYGDKFHGRITANGEIFDMNQMTGAHKTLPFGTKLRVTNEDNGKYVIIRINDRGPWVKGRELDISKAAAQEIGLIPYGVKKLKVEFLSNE